MIDISVIARDLNLPPEKVQRTIELLDDGNTIPFITRFRKDETGGLNEEQILAVKTQATSLRALLERKSFVLKSIESQGKLTDDIRVAIDKATTSRSLEDIYLPFKPRKKSRAQEARQKGLGPLADDIFSGTSPEVDLATRATEYVRVDKGLNSVDEVIRGVSNLLAEKFSDDAELRKQLRQLMQDTGKITAQSIAQPAEDSSQVAEPSEAVKKTKESPEQTALPDSVNPELTNSEPKSSETKNSESSQTPVSTPEPSEANATVAEGSVSSVVVKMPSDGSAREVVAVPLKVEDVAAEAAPSSDADSSESDSESSSSESSVAEKSSDLKSAEELKKVEDLVTEEFAAAQAALAAHAAATGKKPKAKKKKKKKKKQADDPYKDYHNFKQPLKNFPAHRVLSINRGERAKKLRVKIVCDEQKALELAVQKLVPADHPFADYLKQCVQDALSRMVMPSLEREIRREMTEAAEKHAVEVFANNLQNLLLQPPIRNRRVLAIDPGYKRGCSVAIIDRNGDVLHSDHVFVVGNQARRDESKKKVADLVKQYSVDLIGIGNGAACREAEQMVSDCIEAHLADNASIRYVMVNEAGASIYSTSEVGREELPDMSPAIRSAVSIGRRLQDPMSELVKISPANIGVGMYQHDVKAKHLSESLDEVVQFCVNRVGVDVNTASPSLLTYVSGLNALTARRLVEHRKEQGGFKNRSELKEVNGFGDATFVQAAGFLRIADGSNPLDATSIHPESYPIAEKIIDKVNATAAELFPREVTQTATQVPASEPAKSSPAKEAELDLSESANVSTESKSADLPSESASEETLTPTANAGGGAPPKDVAENAEGQVKEETSVESSMESPTDSKPDHEPATEPSKQVVDSRPPRQKPSPELVAARKKRREIVDRISDLKLEDLATEISAGKMLLTDIVRAIKRPDWDPREKARKPVFRRGMIKTDDLKPGMKLEAQVVNVVDFGVFVDIGLGESCLVHVSQLSNRFIRDPQVMYAVGDVISVWISEIDSNKRRVKLTAIRPGSERSRGPRRRKPDDRRKPAHAKSGGKSSRSARGRSGGKKTWKPKSRPPKPVKPITEEMLKGDAPMTSFSDLIQFVKKKPGKDSDE